MSTFSKKYLFFALIATSAIALFSYAGGRYDFSHLKENNPSEWTRAYDIIRAEDTWNKIASSSLPLSHVTIGIIDSGIDAKHPEFMSGGDLTNTVLFGTTPPDAEKDDDGHGTGVAGIIGANNISAFGILPANSPQTNGILSGALPVSKYTLEVRGLPSAESLFFESIKDIFVQSQLLHADVVNMSRGYARDKTLPDGYPDSYLNKNTFFYSLVFPKFPNTLFVFSAGNDGTNVENQTPANINLANTMTVGATEILGDRLDKRFVLSPAISSNFGSGVDISAPGIVYAPTEQGKGELSDGDYTLFNSTSASAPLVTGVAGLLKSIKPSLTPAQIKQILIRTADPIVTDQPIGGRLNAYKAVCDTDVLNCEPATTTGTLQGRTFRMLSDDVTVIPEGGVSVYVKDNDTGTILAETTSDSNGLYTMAVPACEHCFVGAEKYIPDEERFYYGNYPGQIQIVSGEIKDIDITIHPPIQPT